MKLFIQYIIENNSTSAVEQVTKALKSKTVTAIQEARKQVAAEVFTEIEESLSQKHFVSLANHIKNSGVPFSKDHLNVISDFLGKNGPRFNRDRWHDYMAGSNAPSGVKKVKEEVELGEESQSMSKKHFISLANHIKNSPVPFKKEHLNVLADYLQTQNPNFKRGRWHGYIAGENGASGGQVKKKVAEAAVMEGREPKKNTGVHDRIKRHGFSYKGSKNGFRYYENSEGHQIKHKFPTLNGNHSFKHTNSSGKVVMKSANTGDTEIQHHLDKQFPVASRSSAWKGVDYAKHPGDVKEAITEDKVPHPWTKELTSRGFKQSKRAIGDPHWDFDHPNGNHVSLGSLPAAPGKSRPKSYFYMHVKGKEKPVAQGSHKDSLRDALTKHHK